MSTFLTLHSKKALFTHGNFTAKSNDDNSVELFKIDGSAKTVTVTKDADTIFKNSDGTKDLLKIDPGDNDHQIKTQAGIDMRNYSGTRLLFLDASIGKTDNSTGLVTNTNVRLETENEVPLLILDAVSDPSVTSLQAPYLQVNTQFKTSGETELDGAVNITGVTTVDNKLNVNGTIDINGGDLILDENSQLIVAGGSELNVIGDEGIHWFNGGLDSSTTGGYAPTITIGGSSVSDFSGEYVRKTGLAAVSLPDGNGDNIVVGDDTNNEANTVAYFTNATQQLAHTDFFFHQVHKAANASSTPTYLTDDGEYYWNKSKGTILFKYENDWLTTASLPSAGSTGKFYRSQYEMSFQKDNNRNFRKNGQTQWILLRNTAWIGEDDMPQFSYDTVNSIQTNGYFKPVAELSDMTDDSAILSSLRSGEIPFGTRLDKLWDGSTGNYNYTTVVNDASIRKFHLPHFSGSTLHNKVVDNDAVSWVTQYTTGSTSYDDKEYTVLFTLNDLAAPEYDSSGTLTNTVPYDYYLTTADTDGKYFGYFVKKYNLALTVEETSTGSGTWTIKTDVNNDYRYYEAQLPTSDSEYHYRYIMHADSDFGAKFFDFMVGATNGITATQGWFAFSTTQKLNPGVSQTLGEFNLSTYVFNDDTTIEGHPQSQFEVNNKSTKFVPIDAYTTATGTNTSTYDSDVNRDSELIPYHEDHEDGQTMGLYGYSIGWHDNNARAQYNIGWGYPFTSNGGDVTLSNLNIRGNMAALGNSYVNALYGGTSSNNAAPPLLVTSFGTSLSTTPLDYYESTAKKTSSTPFFSIVPDSLSVEVKDQAQLDVQTTTGSSSTSTGALVVAGGAGIGENLNVSDNADVGGTLIVSGATTLHSNLNVTGSSTLKAALGVSGIATISNDTQSNATTSGCLVVAGGVGIAKKLNVGQTTTLSTTLNVTGATTLDNTLGVSGVTTIGNSTDVSGQLLTQGALLVAGGVAITKKLNVGSDAHVAGALTVTGATTINGALGVTGATTLDSTLGVSGAASLASTLSVTGATTLDGTLGVTGAASLASTLGVVGATSLSNSLTVQTNALVVPNTSGAITMTRDLTLDNNKITCKNIEVKGTMTTINTEEVNIKDNHIVLNSTHSANTDKDAGIVSIGNAITSMEGTLNGSTITKTGGTAAVGDFDSDAIILVQHKTNDTDANNGLYALSAFNTSAGTLTVDGSPDVDFVRTSSFATSSDTYDIYKVYVHHMYFDTDTTDGSSIKYGSGNRVSSFSGYGYLDLTQGDVRSSYEEADLSSANHELTTSITKVTSAGSYNLMLPTPTAGPTQLVDGTTYKIINSTSSSVTIEQPSATYNSTALAIELGDGSSDSTVELYPYSTITLTYANTRWYVL